MNKRLRLSMALALALGTTHAYALGLGQIEVKSTLNQPLVAEIPVLLNSPGEADTLSVRLASPDAFARVGLDRPTLQAVNLGFEVLDDARGRKIIRVTTPSSVSDPFLSFLLEVDWGKGKMMREYTVLLDPPSMMPVRGSAPATVAPMPEPEPIYAEPLQDTPAPVAEMTPEPAAQPAPEPYVEPVSPESVETSRAEALDEMSVATATPDAAPAYVAGTYGPVNTGDTLWSIAMNTRADTTVSVNQMMLALLRANPDAFIDDNINRLKKGAVLRIPGREEATTLAAAEAAAQVREQMQAWDRMTATVSQPADAGTSSVASQSRKETTSSGSRLELTPPRGDGDASATTSGASSDGSGRELRAELTRTREEVSTLAQENTELKSRVAELEDLQGDSRRLLELKDSELAAAQQRLKQASLDEAAAAAEAAADASLTDAPLSDDADMDALASDESMDAVAEMDFETATTESDPTQYDDVMDSMSDDEIVADSSALDVEEPAPVIAPLEPISEPVQSRSDSGWFGFNPWIVGGAGAVLLGLILALLMRRGKKPVKTTATAAASATPAVAAYESDEEEGELIEALAQHPDDLYLHLDLLRHYFAANDAVGFELAAESMFAQVGDEQDPAWQEACTLGRQIAPEHPLFAEQTSPDGPDGPDSLADGYADTQTDVDPVDSASADQDVDWDVSESPSITGDDDASYVTEEIEAVGDAPTYEPVADDVAMDDFASESFDAIDADAASTKLELARAYLDMGDAEGARGMLEEVLTEGTTAQRDEARQLIDSIA